MARSCDRAFCRCRLAAIAHEAQQEEEQVDEVEIEAQRPHDRLLAGQLAVIADSGIRRGGDILKAIALGASCVLSGRPTLYGTAVAGEDGAVHALALLKREFDAAMAYTGATKVSDITAKCLWREADAAR